LREVFGSNRSVEYPVMARLPGVGAALPFSRVPAVDPPWGSELLRFDRGRESRR
jgi:hypothetical protein